MKTGIELIAAERDRQIKEEGWTAEHDDYHDEGSLANAGAVYAMTGIRRSRPVGDGELCVGEITWPNDWSLSWFKPSHDSREGRIRELSKAGALIAAEIDRLNRGERGAR